MTMACEIGQRSKDKSRGIGCIIVGPGNEIRSTGFNGFPKGVNDEDESRHARPNKYKWTEHAERNAIYYSARMGVPIDGCRIYISCCPCTDCARAIIQVGIIEIVCPPPDLADPKWGDEFEVVRDLLSEGGIAVRWWPA